MLLATKDYSVAEISNMLNVGESGIWLEKGTGLEAVRGAKRYVIYGNSK